jgi:hypothetical protein
MTLNKKIPFFTDAASLAIFDPDVLKHRVSQACDWFTDCDYFELPEVKEGLISLVGLTFDGFYKAKITNALTEPEKDFATEVIGPLGLVCTSGEIFIGKAECLPGGDFFPTHKNIKKRSDGQFITLAPGEYNLFIYSIDPREYASPSLIEKLSDIVIVISKREAPFASLNFEPILFSDTSSFLFPSKKNKTPKKPVLGKILKSKIVKTARTSSGLAIKYSYDWPRTYFSYEIVLEDMSQVKWHDTITFKTSRVDMEKKIIYAELIDIE